MPLPDKNAAEPTVEIASDMWNLYHEYLANATAWMKLAEELKKKIIEQMGDAFAVLVDGEKVATYRPTAKIAETALIKDFPDLAQHYIKQETRDVFDVQAFARTYPEIAERYRVRSFREVQA